MLLDYSARFNSNTIFFSQSEVVILYVRFGLLNKNETENEFSFRSEKSFFYLILLIVQKENKNPLHNLLTDLFFFT